ncbi:MAG: polyamine ABC transporter substrate-binding protein [Rhizobiales bacterium]|nr:polyamine ABC transporter substrate-binding protein [Hyphomicrobiales bacterium]
MKYIKLLSAVAVFVASAAYAEENVVNIYNWSDYVAEDTIKNFEKSTGIKVVYDVFDSNELLESKMLSGSSGYDVVVPSFQFMARQIQAGVFLKIDKPLLTNYKNLDKNIMSILEGNDPGNAYGVPYMMFTTGIGYNIEKVKERISEDKIGSWDMIFDPETSSKLADCGITLLDAPTEIMAAALNYLGKDPTTENVEDLKAAMELTLSIRKNIRYFHSSQYINDLANGDICVSVGYSGDIFQARDRAAEAKQGVNVTYVIPKEGAQVGFDMMAIPDDAPHKENAHKFINYILEGKVAADISNYVFYANPNTAANEFVAKEVLNNPGIYPPEDVKKKLFALQPKSSRYDRTLTRAWTKIKTGQ